LCLTGLPGAFWFSGSPAPWLRGVHTFLIEKCKIMLKKSKK